MSNQTNSRVTKTGEGLENVETFEVRFDGFEGLPTTKSNSNFVDSPEFTCFGHRWMLRVYPGGIRDSADARVAAFLRHMSDASIEVKVTFTVKSTATRTATYADLGKYNFQPPRPGYTLKAWGAPNFAWRSTLIGALKEGTLVVEVQMRQPESAAHSPSQPFVPENPLCKNIINKFMNEESSDVIFEVGGEQASNDARDKRAKTSTTFYAHRFILQQCTSALGELCKSVGDSATISIMDVKPAIFRHLLYYVYGGKVSDEDLKANAKEIIDAADKYGIIGLKLEAEASFVTSTTISMDSVMDNLLYADSKNCALLKEAAMDCIVDNKSEAIKRFSFNDVPSYLMKDLLTAVARGEKEGDASSDPNDFSTLRVSTLRKKLHEKGLDIDGSRETMIELLEENTSSPET